MGYNTKFKGVLGFEQELTAKQLATLNSMLDEDCREHPEWEDSKGLYYVDLELTKDFSGLKHSGAEKTYDLEKIVNVVTKQMRRQWPEFALRGELLAQGEDIEDRWRLVIDNNGWAVRIDCRLNGKKIKCPHCDGEFFHEEE